MTEFIDFTSPDDDEKTIPRGPLWRHAAWVTGMVTLGVAWGWATALFRIGPEEYGLPSAAPGSVWPYLVAWTVIGLAMAVTLRAVAVRTAVYAAGRITVVLTALGTRLSLGWRPDVPVLGAMAAVALTAAVVWCAIALRGEASSSG